MKIAIGKRIAGADEAILPVGSLAMGAAKSGIQKWGEASTPQLFKSAGFAMLRTPLLPCHHLKSLLDASHPDWNTGDPQLSNREVIEQAAILMRRQLQDIARDPLIREAILATSPDLYEALVSVQANMTTNKSKQALVNLFRYYTRMSTRPTPFGIFAGVALASVEPSMDIDIYAHNYNRKRTRPDMQWVLYMVRELEQRAEVVAQIRFFANSATFTYGGRLYIPHIDSYGQPDEEKTATMRATPVVLHALELVRDGITLDCLTHALLAYRPGAKEEQVRGVINGLREQGAIISELRPPLTCNNAARYLLGIIEGISGCTDIRDKLAAVLELADAYDRQTPGEGIESLRALLGATAVPGSKIRSTLQVDMATGLNDNGLSAVVADEVANAASLLFRITTRPARMRHLAAYRGEFLERYGSGREVPLLELLSEEVGLGPPPTYTHPIRTGEAPQLLPLEYPVREQTLLRLCASAIRNRTREVELDEDLLCKLQVNDNWQDSLPHSLEIYASIAASSQEEVNKGNFQVVIGPRIGTIPAGSSFGRFCDLLGADTFREMKALALQEEAMQTECIFAELIYLPTYGHFANVAVRTAIRQHEIVISASPGVPRANTLPVDDLVIGVQADRFYIRSLSRNKEVVISSTHLLNYATAPNVCRFLAEVSYDGLAQPVPFNWGPAAQLPFLPRLRSGRVVLCPAEWHLPADLLEAAQGASGLDYAAWYEQLQIWRTEWDVPRYIYLAESDNRLLLDLQNPICLLDLASECGKRAAEHGVLRLQEMLPDFDDIWSSGIEGQYMTEFVVPLLRTQSTSPAALPSPDDSPGKILSNFPILSGLEHDQRKRRAEKRNSLAKTPPLQRLRPPGSNWLYAKLYAGRTRHDELLAGPIREFANKISEEKLADNWFFIRYADPEAHIRLRFHGERGTLLHNILPSLTAWSETLIENGLIRKLVLDTYDCEIERYGGLQGLEIAEQIFAVSSIIATDLLALRARRLVTLAPLDLALLSVDRLLFGLGLTAADRLALYRTITKGQQSDFGGQMGRLYKTFHSYRKIGQQLVGDRQWLRAQSGGDLLDTCMDHSIEALAPLGEQLDAFDRQENLLTSKAAFLASCVHMHCNRILGVNRSMEFEAMFHLERTLDSLQRYKGEGIQLDWKER